MAMQQAVSTLGKRIISELKRNQLSMRALSRELDVTQPTVFKWCHDETEPSLRHAKKMAEIFNVPLIWLVSGEDSKALDEGTLFEEKETDPVVTERGFRCENTDSRYYFDVVSDEMEPTLEVGSTCVIDRTANVVTDSGIYLVMSGDHMLLRRFRRALDGSIKAGCDNTEKYPEVETIPMDSKLKIIGRVVSKLSFAKVK